MEQPKVLLHYLSLIHYRKSLFFELSRNKEISFKIISGHQSPYDNLISFTPFPGLKLDIVKNKIVKIGGRKLIWQSKIIKKTIKEKPDILIMQGVDLHILSSLVMVVLHKFLNKGKIMWWGHGSAGKQGKIGHFVRYLFYRLSDGNLVYDEGGKDRLIRFGIPENKIQVIGNCLNYEDYGYIKYPSKSNVKTKSIPTIIFSGRLTRRKRVDLLISALNLLKNQGQNFKCYILGTGPEYKNLSKQIRDNSLQKMIELVGEAYGEEASVYFIKSHIQVIPKAVGLSIIHGFSFGLPLLTSDDLSCHGPEVRALIPNYNGDYFEDSDHGSLAQKILFWIKRIEDEKEVIEKNCIESIKSTYTPISVSNKIISFLKR